MKKLMEERAFEKISVSDICNDCGINRKSFYYHFRDKYDLVNWIFYVGFVTETNLHDYESPWDWLSDICHYFYSEKKFYRAALKIEGQNSFRDYLVEMLQPVMNFFLQDVLPEEEETFYTKFVEDALLTSFTRWLSGGYAMTRGQELDADEYLEHLRQTVERLSVIR